VQTIDLTPVAGAVAPRLPEIVGELLDLLLREIDELRGDEFVVGRLRASLEANVSTLLHLMEEPVDLDLVEPPAGALQFAQRLAQRGVPLSALWRAYHLANARFFRICLQELALHSRTVAELAHRADALSMLLHAYVDHVCERIGHSYDAERERWLRQQDVVRTERIRDLIAGRVGEAAEAETALGYRLTGRHVGIIAWDPAATLDGPGLLGLQRVVTSCAERVGCRDQPLLVPRDQSTLWAWLPLPPRPAAECTEVLRGLLSGDETPVRVAVGEPGASALGFARSHRQAVVAQAVALAAGKAAVPVTTYAAVSGLGFLCQDLDRAREWVGETLGGLVVDDEPHARLRESVEAFLDTGGSLTAAAERLGCHKNTVQYRIRRAEEVLGRSVRERRVDLELALQACRWLGPAVLVAAPNP
jgi:DNA-binding PucR family transcriptional regulator